MGVGIMSFHMSCRLAVKYSIHPLAVEDALKLANQQPKVNKVRGGNLDQLIETQVGEGSYIDPLGVVCLCGLVS